MKRLGQVPTRFPGKTDYRPIGKGVVNWWEHEMECGSKNSDRTLVKKHIEESLLQVAEDIRDYNAEIMISINSQIYEKKLFSDKDHFYKKDE